MEKILIEENGGEIERLRAKAQRNVAKLNQAHAVAPFKTFDELEALVMDCPRFTRDEMRKDKLTRDLMDRGIKVDTPRELIERTRVLPDALESFEFARHTGRGFEVDAEALHHAEEKHRRYVETPFQKMIWDRQEELLKTLNAFDFMGPNARIRNFSDNEFIRFNGRTGRWERNKSVLLHANERTFKY